MTDDNDISVAGFARKFPIEAAAALVAILRDPDASPTARAGAAERILAYSDGKPGQGKPVTTDDLATMSDQQRMELLRQLVSFYAPTEFKDLIAQAVDAALAQVDAKRAAIAPPPRFVRRAPVRSSVIPVPAIEPPSPAIQEVIPPDNGVTLPRGTHETIRGALDGPPNGAVNGRHIDTDIVYRSGLAGDITFRDYRNRWNR